jgi:hypothetical protein
VIKRHYPIYLILSNILLQNNKNSVTKEKAPLQLGGLLMLGDSKVNPSEFLFSKARSLPCCRGAMNWLT